MDKDCFLNSATGHEGRFVVKNVFDGARLSIDVTKKGCALYTTRIYSGDNFPDRPDTYPVRAGQEDLLIKLNPGGSVRGRLVFAGEAYQQEGAVIKADGAGFDGWAITDEKGQFCGKLLGDLGADVIKIERPGGDSSRNIGPFHHDEPDLEKSLHWFAFNTSKRGITLNIESASGQEIFKKLVMTANFIIESSSPGYMDKLNLDYSSLEKINKEIIMVSITPFGQTGPYKDFKAPDIVAWAMGGHTN